MQYNQVESILTEVRSSQITDLRLAQAPKGVTAQSHLHDQYKCAEITYYNQCNYVRSHTKIKTWFEITPYKVRSHTKRLPTSVLKNAAERLALLPPSTRYTTVGQNIWAGKMKTYIRHCVHA